METGLIFIGLLYIAISIGCVIGLFQRRPELPRRKR